MSKAIELARACGDVTTDIRGRVDFSFDSYGIEAFYAKAQAAALREAEKKWTALFNDKHIGLVKAMRSDNIIAMADELDPPNKEPK